MVSTGRGLLQRVRWSDGLLNAEMTIEVASIPFSADLQHSRCMYFYKAVYVACMVRSAHLEHLFFHLSDVVIFGLVIH